VKIAIAFERARHVNSGTSIDPEELPWPKTRGRVMHHPLLYLESDPRSEITHYGGLWFLASYGLLSQIGAGRVLLDDGASSGVILSATLPASAAGNSRMRSRRNRLLGLQPTRGQPTDCMRAQLCQWPLEALGA
jgi:hypothetical protein